MKSRTTPAAELRARLMRAAAELELESPLRLLAKRAAPLSRGGEQLGVLRVLLRLTFDRPATSRGVLVFEWPSTADQHSAVAPLTEWVKGDRSAGGVEVVCRDAVTGGDEDPIAGTHLNVSFRLGELPEALHDLLALAAQVGVERPLLPPIERAERAREEAQRAAEQPVAVEEPEPVAEPVIAEPEIEPEAPRSVADARADAIVHNQTFDSTIHPSLAVNEEITNSGGITFRLVQKRVGGARRRVWTRVSTGVATAARRRA